MWLAGEHWAGLVRGDHEQQVDVDAWYDGAVTVPDLAVVSLSWSSSFDGDRVRSTLSLEVADHKGDLLTADPTSPLAPYGQLLVARAVLQLPSARVIDSVPLGTYRVETSEADYSWSVHDESGRLYPTGGTVQVDALDCLADLAEAEFAGPSAPRAGVATEIRALCRGYVGVDVDGVPDTAVPSSITYDESKWDAIKALAAHVGLVPVPGRDGVLRFREPIIGTPVWEASTSARSIMNATLAHDRQGLINQVLGVGEDTADGVSPVRALVQELTGPFRVSGPLKEKLRRHSSPFYRNNNNARSGAQKILDRSIRDRSLKIPFVCSTNWALDVLDTITVEYDPGRPTVDAMVTSLSCEIGSPTMTGECVIPRSAVA